MMQRALLSALAGLLLTAGTITAQDAARPGAAMSDSAASARFVRPADRREIIAGAAFNSPRGYTGNTPGRDVYIAAVRYSWQMTGRARDRLGYFVDFIPMLVVTGNPTSYHPLIECEDTDRRPARATAQPQYYEGHCIRALRSAYGVGVSPLGLSATLLRRKRVQLTAELSFGAAMFNMRMPYPDAARFNYNVAAGGALAFPLAHDRVLSVGYRLHHLSNGGLGAFNPGIAAHSLYLGLGRTRHAQQQAQRQTSSGR